MAIVPYRPVAIFLRPNYLTKAFSARERLQCHLHTFAYLCERVSPFFLMDLFGPGLPLFARDGAACAFAAERKANNQGEMSLLLSLDGEPVYVLGFNFAPGRFFGLADDSVVFATRMQGLAESYEPVRRATKMFSDVAPQALLFAALQGLAERFGLRHIVGVSAPIQPSHNIHNADQLKRTYDDFFDSIDAAPLARGFYLHDRLASASIYDNMPAKHRARTKTKRRLKAAIAAEVSEALARFAAADDPGIVYLPAAQFSARAGALEDGRIVASGAAGCLMFGPYLYLEAGNYEAEFALEGAAGQGFVLDVTAEQSRATLAQREVDDWDGQPVTLAFTLSEPRDEVEFRLFVREGAALAARGVKLRTLA